MSPRPRWPRRRRTIEVAVTTSPQRLGLCRAALRGLMDTFAPEGGAGLPVPCRPMESLDLMPLHLSFGLVHILAVAAATAVNEELRRSRCLDAVNSDCTALSIVKQGILMVVANVGDSRAIFATMSDDGDVTAVQLTVHFKPDLPHEKGLSLGVDWGITFSSGLGVQVPVFDPVFLVGYMFLGSSGHGLFYKRKYQEAAAHYTVAMKKNPNEPAAFSNRAQFHIFLGALPEDFEDAEKCIELDPNFLLGYVCQAKVQALRCSDESARATYIEALEPVVIDGLNRCLTCIKRSEGRDVGPDNLNDILVIIFLCDKSSMVTFKQAQILRNNGFFQCPKQLRSHMKYGLC